MNRYALNSHPLGNGGSLPWKLGVGTIGMVLTGLIKTGSGGFSLRKYGAGVSQLTLSGENRIGRMTFAVPSTSAIVMSGALGFNIGLVKRFVLESTLGLVGYLKVMRGLSHTLLGWLKLTHTVTLAYRTAVHVSDTMVHRLTAGVSGHIARWHRVSGALPNALSGTLNSHVAKAWYGEGVVSMSLVGTIDAYDGPQTDAPAERTTGGVDLTTRTLTSVRIGG